jgi:hypothetical protein
MNFLFLHIYFSVLFLFSTRDARTKNYDEIFIKVVIPFFFLPPHFPIILIQTSQIYNNFPDKLCYDVSARCFFFILGFSTSSTLSTNIVHDVQRFLQHILKILNIFYHIFSHTKPILLPKGQKRDIFIGAKELNLINNIGYFGNEHFYLRFYRILKSSYESYKVINFFLYTLSPKFFPKQKSHKYEKSENSVWKIY